jgi:hypothetical protein
VRRTRALHAPPPARFPRPPAAAPTVPATGSWRPQTAPPAAPADSRTASRPREPLTAEEKARRYEGGLCLYCGEGGHMANACPNRHAGASRAGRIREIRAAAATAAPASAPTPAPGPTPTSGPGNPLESSGNGSA